MMESRICTVVGCEDKYRALGYCSKHYQRLRNAGSVDEPNRASRDMTENEYIDFIKRNVTVDDQSGCWLWQKSLNDAGYGLLHYKGKNRVVHRLMYILVNGLIDDDVFLDHRNCIATSCCNPEHVRPATPAQNASNRNAKPHSSTGYRNVYPVNRSEKYQVMIKKMYFGVYSTPEEANEVAKQKRKELFGEFAGKDKP